MAATTDVQRVDTDIRVVDADGQIRAPIDPTDEDTDKACTDPPVLAQPTTWGGAQGYVKVCAQPSAKDRNRTVITIHNATGAPIAIRLPKATIYRASIVSGYGHIYDFFLALAYRATSLITLAENKTLVLEVGQLQGLPQYSSVEIDPIHTAISQLWSLGEAWLGVEASFAGASEVKHKVEKEILTTLDAFDGLLADALEQHPSIGFYEAAAIALASLHSKVEGKAAVSAFEAMQCAIDETNGIGGLDFKEQLGRFAGMLFCTSKMAGAYEEFATGENPVAGAIAAIRSTWDAAYKSVRFLVALFGHPPVDEPYLRFMTGYVQVDEGGRYIGSSAAQRIGYVFLMGLPPFNAALPECRMIDGAINSKAIRDAGGASKVCADPSLIKTATWGDLTRLLSTPPRRGTCQWLQDGARKTAVGYLFGYGPGAADGRTVPLSESAWKKVGSKVNVNGLSFKLYSGEDIVLMRSREQGVGGRTACVDDTGMLRSFTGGDERLDDGATTPAVSSLADCPVSALVNAVRPGRSALDAFVRCGSGRATVAFRYGKGQGVTHYLENNTSRWKLVARQPSTSSPPANFEPLTRPAIGAAGQPSACEVLVALYGNCSRGTASVPMSQAGEPPGLNGTATIMSSFAEGETTAIFTSISYNGSHCCGGAVGGIAMRRQAGTWTVVNRAPKIRSMGSWGQQPPPTVVWVQSGRALLVFDDGWTGQGETTSAYTAVGYDSGFFDAFNASASQDNAGRCAPYSTEKCYRSTASLDLKDSANGLPTATVHETGTSSTGKVDITAVFAYNPRTHSYPQP